MIFRFTYPQLTAGKLIQAAALFTLLLPVLATAQTFTISTVYGTCSASASTPPCNGGYAGDGGAATSAQFNGPTDLIFDSSGNLYISDCSNSRIREVNTSGQISTIAGNGTAGFAGDGSSATASGTEINCPSGMAFDSSGNLYFADNLNFEVRKITSGTISTVAGNNGKGAAFAGDLGSATQAQLWNPWGVAVDSAGNIYIGDAFNNVVRVVCETQSPIGCGSNYFAAGGTTWVSGDIDSFAGQDNCGGTASTSCSGYNGDGGLAPSALLNNPNAVLLDSAGDVYISDSGNSVIRKVTPAGVISTVAGDGSGLTGYSGDGGKANMARLNNPKGIAFDPNGNLYIADTDNSVIRMVTPDGYITTIAGTGSLGYSGDGGAATSAELYFPSGVAYYNGKIYIADNGNNVIRLLTPVQQTPQINAGGVVNDASYSAPVAPGSIAAVFGTFYLTSPVGATTVPLSQNLENLSLSFGSTAAPLYYASDGQVNIQVPWEVSTSGPASLTATLNGTVGAAQSVNIAPYAPAIFTTNAQGTGAGAILDSNYNLVGASNPAIAGTTFILIYCTGLGPVSNTPADGAAAGSGSQESQTTSPVTVTIGGITVNADFAGLAPGYVGLYQVNVQVPAGVTANAAVPLTISVGGVTSNSVTVAVQ